MIPKQSVYGVGIHLCK